MIHFEPVFSICRITSTIYEMLYCIPVRFHYNKVFCGECPLNFENLGDLQDFLSSTLTKHRCCKDNFFLHNFEYMASSFFTLSRLVFLGVFWDWVGKLQSGAKNIETIA